jgi:hypothetical protein
LQCGRLSARREPAWYLKAPDQKWLLFDRGLSREDVVSSLLPILTRTWFGDAVILIFLLAQAADGMCTYIGLSTFGVGLEANPLLQALIATFGLGTAVTSAKIFAAILGMSLHRLGVHGILAGLTGIYLFAAVLPWVGIFLMY